MTEERTCELENMIIQTSKTEKKRKKEQNIQELWNSYKRCNIDIIGILEREKGTEAIFEAMVSENFPVNIRHQTTDPESSGKNEQDKCQNK